MGDTTAIEWADSTFNPVWGCQKVSPACDFCYAEALANVPEHLEVVAEGSAKIEYGPYLVQKVEIISVIGGPKYYDYDTFAPVDTPTKDVLFIDINE